ncbi:TetR family transcriptional regulator [Kineococcus sp. SYSU DK001]|uniref:TetR family transcriptional regulator n=1 Tax=Kineococcus sp. SYSU DK001 TaxID=3383122 RepID=UPI003D7E83B7
MTASPQPERARPASRAQATREAILDAAERLFAEHGLDNVSHRQISAAAGQGNNAAVNYHFGTTADLVEAIVERHLAAVESLRARQLARVEGSADLRAWVDCLVRPTAQHLEELGSPTWYARLSAQLATDPRRHDLVVERALRSPTLRRIVDGLQACLPDVPPAVRAERSDMMRLLSVHLYAERETALATGRAPARASWGECADGLVDAVVGMLTASVSRVG